MMNVVFMELDLSSASIDQIGVIGEIGSFPIIL